MLEEGSKAYMQGLLEEYVRHLHDHDAMDVRREVTIRVYALDSLFDRAESAEGSLQSVESW